MEAAGLTDLLQQEGDFTLFAPNDKAFAALSERDVTLLKGRFAVFYILMHFMALLYIMQKRLTDYLFFFFYSR